ncbi:MAG TPA: TrmH family RNA methyltransferase [bacterium]|nr:TrmH family RNA methyltransferase [bacterium]
MNPRFEIVLVRPEIAGNTGNIGRACMALGCRLHLVHPLGFVINDANLRRAGMDYWQHLDLVEHDSLEAWMGSVAEAAPVYLLSTKASQDWDPQGVPTGATLVFGNEGHGLPEAVHARWGARARRIPMDVRARSLNLSSSVSLVLGSLLWR